MPPGMLHRFSCCGCLWKMYIFATKKCAWKFEKTVDLLVDQKRISFVVNAFEWHLITARKYNFKLKAI